ncbi:MAG: DUF1992 domain-containing protein [Anaerolineae bacterium]|nr:DUF1992 domain-containing protein [Anaerolineae bacterium]
MNDHKSLMDEILGDAFRRGEFDNLPGAGKRLKIEDDLDNHVPPDLRMTHRMLKDSNLAPDWIEEGKAIEDAQAKVLSKLQSNARMFQGLRADARRSATPEQMLAQLDARWRTVQERFRADVASLNRRILDYNLKLPPGFSQKPAMNAERELAKVQV